MPRRGLPPGSWVRPPPGLTGPYPRVREPACPRGFARSSPWVHEVVPLGSRAAHARVHESPPGFMGRPPGSRAAHPRVHEYVHPGLYCGRTRCSKICMPPEAGAPRATVIKPRVNVLVNPGCETDRPAQTGPGVVRWRPSQVVPSRNAPCRTGRRRRKDAIYRAHPFFDRASACR
jgi:hypothetical protein